MSDTDTTDSPDGETDDLSPNGDTDDLSPNGDKPPGQLSGGSDDDPETFDREYVEKLRAEAAEHRVKAKRFEAFAEETFYARVAALGKLADPTDLTYDETLLEDRAALEAAVDDLIGRKPHLADRRPVGDVDQGARVTGDTVDLASMLRARAG